MAAGVKIKLDQVRERFAKIGAELVGDYINANTKVLARCLKHGGELLVSPATVFRGGVLMCCKLESAMLSEAEVAARLSLKGYALISPYKGTEHRVVLACSRHLEQHSVLARSVLCDRKNLPCCGRESISIKMSGRSVSDEFRRASSERQSNGRAYWTGRKFSQDHRRRIAESGAAGFAGSIDRHIEHSRRGVTAGKEGFFYIFRVGDHLKLGSVCKMTPAARIAKIRRDTGLPCSIVFVAQVPDAGAYEADMMDRCRDHWLRGEYFHDWLRATLA